LIPLQQFGAPARFFCFWDEADLADSEEAVLLQRRARRRLVGAIALALLVIIEIPSQDSSKFNPRLLPQPPAEAAPKTEAPAQEEPAKPAEPVAALEPKVPPPKAEPPKAEPPKAEPAKVETRRAEPVKTEAPKAAETAAKASPRASAGDFVIALGLFSKPENAKRVQADVSKAGFKVFSEAVKGEKGELLRVRAGPYPSREAAEQARDKLKSRGVNVGPIMPRDQP
jgi:DedD protein